MQESIIIKAYDIDEWRVIGGEAWTGTDRLATGIERFDLDATTDAPATTAQEMIMLQKVLATRFGLRLANEKKTMPVFALVVSKGGPKFQALGDGERPLPPPEHEPDKINFDTSDTIRSLVAKLNLMHALDRIVVDQTALQGRYGIWLKLGVDPPDIGGGVTVHFDDIPEALKQIGLEIKPTVASVDFYAISSAHPPTPN